MKLIMKVIGLEFLIVIFFIINGAYTSLNNIDHPLFSYLGIVPLAFILYGYLLFSKNARKELNLFSTSSTKETLLYSLPLVSILMILYLGNGGLNLSDVTNVILVFITHLFIIAFIEDSLSN